MLTDRLSRIQRLGMKCKVQERVLHFRAGPGKPTQQLHYGLLGWGHNRIEGKHTSANSGQQPDNCIPSQRQVWKLNKYKTFACTQSRASGLSHIADMLNTKTLGGQVVKVALGKTRAFGKKGKARKQYPKDDDGRKRNKYKNMGTFHEKYSMTATLIVTSFLYREGG